jgi:general stress protein YciG
MSAEITGGNSPNENKSSSPSSNGVAAAPEKSSHNDELTADPPPRPFDATEPAKVRRPRGFAAMDRKLVSEIARKGGKAAHTAGTAHEFTSDEARAAGSKGGRATHAKRRKAIEDHQ